MSAGLCKSWASGEPSTKFVPECLENVKLFSKFIPARPADEGPTLSPSARFAKYCWWISGGRVLHVMKAELAQHGRYLMGLKRELDGLASACDTDSKRVEGHKGE